MEPVEAAGRGQDFVYSLDRGLRVIRAFGPGRERLTLSEVAQETGLSRAAARRFLLTLVELGYVRGEGREFSLRPRVLELGYAYLSGLGLAEVAQPHMEELVAEVHESSSISVLDGDDIVYVVRVPTKRIMTITIAVGTRLPAYATSMGRVLLAARPPEEIAERLTALRLERLTGKTVVEPRALRGILAEVAEQGFATVDQELEDGVRSLAVPIRDVTGAVIAAINVSAHASRVTMEALQSDVLPPLAGTAAKIERDLVATAGATASLHGRRPG
jgi:IclR family transcriptional regulator, pca regulon regulatory protein